MGYGVSILSDLIEDLTSSVLISLGKGFNLNVLKRAFEPNTAICILANTDTSMFLSG